MRPPRARAHHGSHRAQTRVQGHESITIVSKDWVDQMTQMQIQSDFLDINGQPIPYGYYWYVSPNGSAAWGNGGQYLLVDPEKQLVIAHIALPDTANLDGSELTQFVALVHDLL